MLGTVSNSLSHRLAWIGPACLHLYHIRIYSTYIFLTCFGEEGADFRGVFSLAKKKRAQIDVICEILGLCDLGATKTRIMYRANLNSRLMRYYVNPLAGKDYLRLVLRTDGPPEYCLTAKGRLLLQRLDVIRRELDNVFSGGPSMPLGLHSIVGQYREQALSQEAEGKYRQGSTL